MTSTIDRHIQLRKQKGNFRSLKTLASPIDFASNDTFGLSQKLTVDADRWGSTGSRLLTGNSKEAESLEKMLADFHQAESALLFNSGYTANLGLLSSIAHRKDIILFDDHVHASTRDGSRLSGAAAFHFKHNDVLDLERLLIQFQTQEVYVCVESVYSCDGSLAPLKSLCELSKKYPFKLIVDEAHATGIYGNYGEGRVVEEHLALQVFARVVTFSKALGVFGAVVLGSEQLKEYLINFCRPWIYSTALPYPILKGIQAAYSKLPDLNHERMDLKKLIQEFRCRCNHKYYSSTSHIQAFSIPGNKEVKELSKKLENFGFNVRALLSPTVAPGTERLRICLHSYNTIEQLDQFFKIMEVIS